MLSVILAALDGYLESFSVHNDTYNSIVSAELKIKIPYTLWYAHVTTARSVISDTELAIDLVSPNAPVGNPARATTAKAPVGRLARVATVGED